MSAKIKSGLEKRKRIRRSGKTSASKKFPTLQKRDSKGLGKTIHEQRGSAIKMMKERIQERMAHLASFPEFYPNPIVEIDFKGQVQYLNPSAESLFPDLRSKGSNHPWIADFESLALLVNRDPNKAHLREKRVGDSWYHQMIYSTPEWNRIRIYGYDVTRQKRAEELISQSEERYRKLFEDDLTGDFLAASDGTILDCNPSFLKIFGFASKEEGLKTNFLNLYPNEEEKEAFMNRLREKGKLEFYESPLVKRDGSSINVVKNIVGHFDEHGNLQQFKGYLFDDTRHKHAQNELKESERKYRELYEGSQDGYVHLDMNGNIKGFNSAFKEMLGYSEKKLMGVTYIALTPEKWHSMEAEIVKEQVLVKGYSDVYEKELRKKNGTIFPISLRTYLIKDREGKPQGMWAFVRDITRRKELEKNLRKARDELEMRVKERTAELEQTNDRLREENQERIHTEQSLKLEEARLDALLHLSQMSEAPLKEIAGVILEQTVRLTQSKIGFVGFMNEDESVYTLHAVSKDVVKECNVTGDPMQWHVVDAGIWAEAIRQRKTLFVNDYSEPHPRKKGLPPGHPNVERFMVVPIFEGEKIVAIAGVGNKASEYDKSDERQVVLLLNGMWSYLQKNRSREELARANELLERMFSSIDISVAYMDKDFNFIRVNRAYAEADEQEPEFYVGKNHFVLFPNEENEQIFRKVVESGEPYSVYAKPFEYAAHPERRVTYWDWNLQPVKESDGSIGGIILSLMDVTERVQAQEAIEAERQRFNSVLEMLPVYLVLLTPDYHVSFANRFFRQRFGESHDQRCYEYLFGRSEPCEVCETYSVLETKAPHHWEWTGPDGRNYDVFDFPYTDVDGSTLILEMGIDITERKRAEDALRQNEELLRNVLELLPVGIWIIDKNGVIIQGNPAGHQMWAGSRYVGIEQYGEYKGWWLDTGRRIEPEEWAAARAVKKGETSLNEEIEIECFDGTHKIILNSAVPLQNDRKEFVGAFIINQDITERKRTEKVIRQVQKMEALGRLAGGIAHDFNNILMPIVINTELAVLDTPESSPVSNYLKLIQEAANRGKDLIKQIITFSRQREQVKAPIEIEPVIGEALKFLRSSIPKNIEIREHIGAASSLILADSTQIHQVLMNLCSNASYAMREKGGVLDVSLTTVEIDADMVNRHLDLRPGPYLRLTVADTGQGMDKEIMERIFDPFFTTKKPGEGTGMGLAVVHGIVKNHGGAITVYSEVRKGSTFNVFLPLIKEKLEPETAPSETITMGRERILLIDDEEIQIRSVQPMLERLGYKVVAKKDALEALEVFKEQPNGFDLVITDQSMPHLTGRELAEELLRIRPDIPIILCTGFSEVIHEEEAKAMGIREFVMKPFSLKEMAGIIRKSLARDR
jgi:PAS domain S-box-containing protein